MIIKVPATSANLGPGFDSCGLALNLYLTIEIGEESEKWELIHDVPNLPHDETNLIIQTALSIKADLMPRQLIMTSAIPTARGLGSSSSAIVAGIELANILGELDLSKKEKLTIATTIEGHPDNVAPAIYGNFVIASHVEGKTEAIMTTFPSTDILVVIPKKELLTSESRAVLPNKIDYREAVEASAITNMMIAGILSQNLKIAGEFMMRDLWHEKYREPLVPYLTEIKKLRESYPIYGAVLSGAGPTVLILVEKGKSQELLKDLSERYHNEAVIMSLEVDTLGTTVNH